MPWLVALVLLCSAWGVERSAAAAGAGAQLEAALAVLREGDLPAARAVVQRLVRERPRQPRYRWLLGRVLWLDQAYPAAAGQLEQAAELCPQAADIHYWLGRARGEQARQAPLLQRPVLARRTLAAFRRAVNADSDHVQARLALLQYYLRAPALLGGGRDEAQAQVEAIAGLDPLWTYRARGLMQAAAGDFEQAREGYQQARREYPDSPLPLFWLAESHRSRQAYAAALEIYRELAWWSPPQPRAWYEFAVTAEAMGRYRAEALGWLQHYVDEPLALDAVAPARVRQLYRQLQAGL